MSAPRHVLYYNAQNRAGVIQKIETDGSLTTLKEFAPGTFGPWTHIIC